MEEKIKTELEKMRSEELYSFADPDVYASIARSQKLCARFRMMSIHDEDYREVLEELIPGIPQSSMICPPFHCQRHQCSDHRTLRSAPSERHSALRHLPSV